MVKYLRQLYNNISLNLKIVISSSIILITRVPFIGVGYGLDWDAWRVIHSALTLDESGQYIASRLPGYPILEISYSYIWQFPYICNGITALLSVISYIYFFLILDSLGSKDKTLISTSLFFIPVIFINSTNSMDYIWALAFILSSSYYTMHKKYVISGILLGIAVGCRMTSIIMAIPLSYLLYTCESNNFGNIFLFAVSSLALSAVAFMPVIKTYGLSFLSAQSQWYPPLLGVARVAGTDVWGVVGLFALAGALTQLGLRYCSSAPRSISSLSKRHGTAFGIAVALYILLFLALPHEAGYLIPALPFTFILLARYLPRRELVIFCTLIILSPFIFSLKGKGVVAHGQVNFSEYAINITLPHHRLTLDPLYGPIVSNHLQRQKELNLLKETVDQSRDIPEHSVIIAGDWFTKLRVYAKIHSYTGPTFTPSLAEKTLTEYTEHGYKLYYLPGQDEYNYSTKGDYLSDYGAVPLLSDSLGTKN